MESGVEESMEGVGEEQGEGEVERGDRGEWEEERKGEGGREKGGGRKRTKRRRAGGGNFPKGRETEALDMQQSSNSPSSDPVPCLFVCLFVLFLFFFRVPFIYHQRERYEGRFISSFDMNL